MLFFKQFVNEQNSISSIFTLGENLSYPKINQSFFGSSVGLHKSYSERADVPQLIFFGGGGTHLYLSYRPENIEMESDSDDKASRQASLLLMRGSMRVHVLS